MCCLHPSQTCIATITSLHAPECFIAACLRQLQLWWVWWCRTSVKRFGAVHFSQSGMDAWHWMPTCACHSGYVHEFVRDCQSG